MSELPGVGSLGPPLIMTLGVSGLISLILTFWMPASLRHLLERNKRNPLGQLIRDRAVREYQARVDLFITLMICTSIASSLLCVAYVTVESTVIPPPMALRIMAAFDPSHREWWANATTGANQDIHAKLIEMYGSDEQAQAFGASILQYLPFLLVAIAVYLVGNVWVLGRIYLNALLQLQQGARVRRRAYDDEEQQHHYPPQAIRQQKLRHVESRSSP